MARLFSIEDLNHAKEKLEAKEVERPLLVTHKDFEDFNKSISKFPPILKLKNKSE